MDFVSALNVLSGVSGDRSIDLSIRRVWNLKISFDRPHHMNLLPSGKSGLFVQKLEFDVKT
jgi:hypothetical protein